MHIPPQQHLTKSLIMLNCALWQRAKVKGNYKALLSHGVDHVNKDSFAAMEANLWQEVLKHEPSCVQACMWQGDIEHGILSTTMVFSRITDLKTEDRL